MGAVYEAIYESCDGGDRPSYTIRTTGCDCCSSTERLTEAVLKDAINAAEEWLNELRSYEGRL